MDASMHFPGTTNAWTMPIKNRIDMLTTGIRTPIGIKVFGPDLKKIEAVGQQVEEAMRRVKGTRSVFAERVAGGYFLDFDLKRENLSRYGLTVADAQAVIMSAVGGENVTTVIEGRARFPVSVRYPRELRDDVSRLAEVPVRTPTGAQIPLGQLADLRTVQGPSMVRNENGLLSGYVYVDTAESDIGGFVERAKEAVAASVKLEPGYSLEWSGQYENMLRVRERLKLVLPITLFLIAFLLYANTGSATKAGIVLLAVPFSVVGAVWLMRLLGYNESIAVWAGMIALMGLDAETGVCMLLFLDLGDDDPKGRGLLRDRKDLCKPIVHAPGRPAPSSRPSTGICMSKSRQSQTARRFPNNSRKRPQMKKLCWRRRPDLNRRVEVLQTSALTTWLRRPERSTIEERRRSIKIRRETTRPGASRRAATQPEQRVRAGVCRG